MANLLIEVGVEELPLASLDVIYAELAARTEKALQEARLGFQKILVEATPRRIALFVEGLEPRQKDQTLELRGPSLEKAYDAAGNPTPALQGFLRGKNAVLKDAAVVESPKGKFVMIRREEKGKPSASVLPEILGPLLTSLPFPSLCAGMIRASASRGLSAG